MEPPLNLASLARWFTTALATWYAFELGSHVVLRRVLGDAVPADTVTQVRQCVVSAAHDMFAVVTATLLLLSIGPHPDDANAYYVPLERIAPVACGLFAFFLWDLLHMLFNLHLPCRRPEKRPARPRQPRAGHSCV